MSKSEREFKHIWNTAELFLRRRGYNITLEQLNEVLFPNIEMVVTEPTDFKAKVALVIHEAVEVEEIYRKTGKWQNPRDYYDEWERKDVVIIEPHTRASNISRLYDWRWKG